VGSSPLRRELLIKILEGPGRPSQEHECFRAGPLEFSALHEKHGKNRISSRCRRRESSRKESDQRVRLTVGAQRRRSATQSKGGAREVTKVDRKIRYPGKLSAPRG